MNDNIDHEGPKHLFAAALLNDLMIILENADKRGIDPVDEDGFPIYGFGYWSRECAKALGVKKIAP